MKQRKNENQLTGVFSRGWAPDWGPQKLLILTKNGSVLVMCLYCQNDDICRIFCKYLLTLFSFFHNISLLFSTLYVTYFWSFLGVFHDFCDICWSKVCATGGVYNSSGSQKPCFLTNFGQLLQEKNDIFIQKNPIFPEF